MFNRKKSKPLAWLDTMLEALPQKDEPKHRLRNSLIGTGVVVAVISTLTKKKADQ